MSVKVLKIDSTVINENPMIQKNTSKVDNYNDYRWKNDSEDLNDVKYNQIINFCRDSKANKCVMCGNKGNIPSQNKDVCKDCDSSFWYHHELDLIVKFCKGKFSHSLIYLYNITLT